jgi:hypothetical protein
MPRNSYELSLLLWSGTSFGQVVEIRWKLTVKEIESAKSIASDMTRLRYEKTPQLVAPPQVANHLAHQVPNVTPRMARRLTVWMNKSQMKSLASFETELLKRIPTRPILLHGAGVRYAPSTPSSSPRWMRD